MKCSERIEEFCQCLLESRRGTVDMFSPKVDTCSGQLRGSVQKSIDGFDFCAFKGIPYAKPPVGELRFKDPVPAESWSGIKDALEFGPICAQFDFISNVTDGSDDCLYLNVYTKSVEQNILRPVMVYIHGGGFMFGSGNDLFYGPDYLMKKDIVLVTINYRLGVFGFLNLEDNVAPGNQGLKDQVMALQWVRDNIVNFGGDPDNVTIFGESAGGASVHFLTMSPLAKGLFHKAISQSGVALCPWASIPGDPKKYAYEMCELLGKKTTDAKEIVKFLRTVDTMKLLEVQGQIGVERILKKCLSPFGPGVDDKSPMPFMPVPIKVAAEQGAHVPYLLGHTDREAILMYKLVEKDDYDLRNSNFEDYVNPHTMNMLKENDLTSNDLKYMFFKNEKISNKNTEKIIDLMSDTLFLHGIHKIIRTQVEHNSAPTYMYQFTYDQGHSYSKMMFNSNIPGAGHLDELMYLFGMKFYNFMKEEPIKKGTKDYQIMEQMVELWTNFAQTGRPTPTISKLVPLYWKPVLDGTVFQYLNIGDNLKMEKLLNVEERYSYKKN